MHSKSLVRIAYVRFTPQGSDHVAQCDREDIGVGAKVEVLMHADTPQPTRQTAVVVGIAHERWSCRCRVDNLCSEVSYTFEGEPKMLRRTVSAAGLAAQARAARPAEVEQLCRDELVARLQQMGFRTFQPRTVSWMCALIASNRTQTLYILVGKRSIDFKLYDTVCETRLDAQGRLHTDGGTFVRNWYAESDENIHALTLAIAERFVADEAIPPQHLRNHGISWSEQKRRHKASLPQTAEEEMHSLYEDLALGDGEPVYLSDGVWLHADGSMHDES